MSADTVIASLRENFSNCKIIGTNIYPGEWLYITHKIDAFYKVPKTTEPGYIQSIIDILKTNNVDFIVPLTDPEVDILSENRAALKTFPTELAICKNDVIKICRDKELLYDYFADHPKIDIIKSYSVNEATNIALNYPIVAKPKKGRSSEGLKYISSKKELLILDDEYIIQEFIEGVITTVDLVRDHWGNIVCIPRKELIRTPNGAGLSVEIFQDKEIERLIIEITEELDINGCMNIEFIRNQNSYYLMDINPRFSAGIGFSKLAGYDFVKNHINVFRKKQIEPIKKIQTGIATKHHTEHMLRQGI